MIGVVAWDADSHWFGVRTLAPGERVSGISGDLRALATIAMAQLQRWVERGAVPYAKGALHPWESGFWVAASRVMTTAIRVDFPRSMDPLKDRETELELLFEALAQPLTSSETKRKRIDFVITDALGDAARWLKRSIDLPAFHGAQETVMRGVVGTNSSVIIEGVNLASASARKDADALVSKLLRIIEAPVASRVGVVVGYVASPGGLNGETDMRDWIKAKVTDNVFDVVNDGISFRSAAYSELRDAGLAMDDR